MFDLEFKGSNQDIGLITRTPTSGPELDMVEKAVPSLASLFTNKGHKSAIFWEPKVEVGFPDLVVALYSPETYSQWPEARNRLTTLDLKIIHHLYHSKGMSSEKLEQKLGLSSREVLRSIERLLDAGIVRRNCYKWRLPPTAEIFGIQRLIAIEAKLSNWSGAFSQASSNTWFASESYILSPTTRPILSTQQRSHAQQVGILSSSNGSPEPITKAPRRRLPASYATWQFNEWIGRELMRSSNG